MEKRELSDIGFALLRKLIASAGAKQAVEIAATAGIFTYAYIACSKQMMDPAGKNEIIFLNILICKLANLKGCSRRRFLDASSHLYIRSCPSVGWSDGRLPVFFKC